MNAQDKLRELNIYLDSIEAVFQIFESSTNYAKFEDNWRKSTVYNATGLDQFLTAFFYRIQEKDERIVVDGVKTLGQYMDEQIIKEYLTTDGDPTMIFFSGYPEISIDKRNKFFDEARQFSLDTVREYLGIKSTKHQSHNYQIINPQQIL